MILDRRIYTTRDGRYVEEGDPDAAFLAFPAGYELADSEARRLGINPPKAKPASADKARRSPAANKSRR